MSSFFLLWGRIAHQFDVVFFVRFMIAHSSFVHSAIGASEGQNGSIMLKLSFSSITGRPAHFDLIKLVRP